MQSVDVAHCVASAHYKVVDCGDISVRSAGVDVSVHYGAVCAVYRGISVRCSVVASDNVECVCDHDSLRNRKPVPEVDCARYARHIVPGYGFARMQTKNAVRCTMASDKIVDCVPVEKRRSTAVRIRYRSNNFRSCHPIRSDDCRSKMDRSAGNSPPKDL